MVRESVLRRAVLKALVDLDAQPVENVARPGTPDVECLAGWIELKVLPRWPTRAGTIVRVPTFTPQQRNWHLRRHLRGGRSWVLLRVGEDYSLFIGIDASQHLGRSTQALLMELAVKTWRGRLNACELRATLCASARLATESGSSSVDDVQA